MKFLTNSGHNPRLLLMGFLLASAGIQLGTLVLLLSNTLWVWKLSQKPGPALVQLADGSAIEVETQENDYRSPEVLKRFVRDFLGQMFTWNAITAGEGNPIELEGGGRVGAASWQASFAMSEANALRVTFLSGVASLIPSDAFDGQSQSVVDFIHLSEPREISAEGEARRWEIDAIANLTIVGPRNPAGTTVPLNKTVVVQAKEPSHDPLPELSTPIQKAIYQLKQQGLEIVEIRDFIK